MPRRPDHLSAALKNHLVPMLAAEGFSPRGSRQFIRVRGDLLDALGFQVSQWDREFYLHQSIQPLSDPYFAPEGYRVGARFHRENDTAEGWGAESLEQAQASIASVARFITATSLPWFGSVAGLSDFLVCFLADPNSPLDGLELASLLARLGHPQRPWWICNALEGSEEQDERTRETAQAMRVAIDEGSVREFLDDVRRENLQRLGLPAG